MKKITLILLVLLCAAALSGCAGKKTIAIEDYIEVSSNGSANGYGVVDYKFDWDKLNSEIGQSKIDKAVKSLNPSFYNLAKDSNVQFSIIDLLSISDNATNTLKNGDVVTYEFAPSLEFYNNDVNKILDELGINAVSYNYTVSDLVESIAIDFFQPFKDDSLIFKGEEGKIYVEFSELEDMTLYEDDTIKVDFQYINRYNAQAMVYKNGELLTGIKYFGYSDYPLDLKVGDTVDVYLNSNIEILAQEGYIPQERNKTYTVSVISE